jgi:hypothetical protein
MASSIDDKYSAKSKVPGDYRLPTDGPHRYVKKTVDSEKEKDEQPPYVIAVTKDQPESEAKLAQATSKYDPKELRSKGKTMLKSPNITSHQKDVLQDILGPDEAPKIT